MTNCPECGFELWDYDLTTRTCKHGHLWKLDGTAAGAPHEYVRAPSPVPDPVVVHTPAPRSHLLVAAGTGTAVAVAVELLLRLLIT